MNCHCIRISINHNSRSVLYEHTWKDLIKELWPSSAAAVKEGRIVWFFVSSNSYLFKDFLSLMRSISARPWCSDGSVKDTFVRKAEHFYHICFSKEQLLWSMTRLFLNTNEILLGRKGRISSFEKVSIELSQDPSSTFLRIAWVALAFERAKKWKPNVCFHSRCFHVQGKITTEVSLDCEENEAKTLKRDDA